MPREFTKRLLVEGAKDKRLFPYLMEKNGVNWPKGDEPVDIRDLGQKLIAKHDASAILKESGLRSLGIVLDADDNPEATWETIKSRFQDAFNDMPADIRAEGYISAANSHGIRLGVWIMPDNQTSGMLESFLKLLVRDNQKLLFEFAETVCTTAKTEFDAPFKDVHRDKATMHAFLAWQDEPGRQLHEAIDHAVLDPKSPQSIPFVTWFRDLFEV